MFGYADIVYLRNNGIRYDASNWSYMVASKVAFCSLPHFVMLEYLFNKHSLFFSHFILNFNHKKALNRMVESWFH